MGTLWPNFMSASNPGPMFMMAVAIAFSFGVALGIALVWGIYGGIYFFRISKTSGRTTMIKDRVSMTTIA